VVDDSRSTTLPHQAVSTRLTLTITSGINFTMFLLRKPTDGAIRDYLAAQKDQPFSYDSVGCTHTSPQPRRGWNIDCHRVLLGKGEDAFQRAMKAIDHWRMFPCEVAKLCWPAPPHEGQSVAVLYWAAPARLWMLFAARVISLFNETTERAGHKVEQYGFAYGTLPDHAERGEERFLVEWDRTDDSVWYELLAVSQPRHWLARLVYPYARYEQARFRRLSGAAMQRAVQQGDER
jgi:uncharacterized protein (UPF0548 family)